MRDKGGQRSPARFGKRVLTRDKQEIGHKNTPNN
jgi:hypothetical protein